MTNIGEALTTRLARERLEAIKKIIPVRESVSEKLQARQQARVEFTEGAEELFKLVTTATESVNTAIVGKPDPDKQQKSLLQAIEELKSKPAENVAVPVVKKVTQQITNPAERFTQKYVDLLKAVPEYKLPETIMLGFTQKHESLKPEYGSMTDDNFIKYSYRIRYNKKQISRDNIKYDTVVDAIRNIDISQKPSTSRQQIERFTISEPETYSYTGQGYTSHDLVDTCPDNIINDVSRLEVLIGGKRAGNNSREL